MKRGRQLSQKRGTALRKLKLSMHNFKQKKSALSTIFFFPQSVTYNSKGSNKGTDVQLSTKPKEIKFSNFLKSFQVWSSWGFGFFSESCFVNSYAYYPGISLVAVIFSLSSAVSGSAIFSKLPASKDG